MIQTLNFGADELHFSIIATNFSKRILWVDVNKTTRKKHILLRYSKEHCNVHLKKTSSVEMVMRLYFELDTPIWNVPSLSYTTVIAKYRLSQQYRISNMDRKQQGTLYWFMISCIWLIFPNDQIVHFHKDFIHMAF